jgi:delta-1-pyrroline-5-carboxylate synthetase
MSSEPKCRALLRNGARRVCIKAGTAVVANEDGSPSLTRVGAITEQIAELNALKFEVILVSSGAVGMGKRLLRKQGKQRMSYIDMQSDKGGAEATEAPHLSSPGRSTQSNESFIDLLDSKVRPHSMAQKKKFYDSACAAAGQFEMMNLYSSLFNQCDVAASQILVTQADFADPQRLQNLQYAVDRLLNLGIVPIINENDAVSANLGYTADDIFSDNDSLAALCARSFGAEALLLLTDVEGVFDKPPTDAGAKKLDLYVQASSEVAIGAKSAQGRGGMASKIEAATSAVAPGSRCGACVIASGADLTSIRSIFVRDDKVANKGTLFLTPGSSIEQQAIRELRALKVSTDRKDYMPGCKYTDISFVGLRHLRWLAGRRRGCGRRG